MGIAVAVAPIAAGAVTLQSSIDFSDGAFTYPDTSASVDLPNGATWIGSTSVRTANSDGIYRTPYDETSNAAVENTPLGNAAAAAIEYFAAGPGNPDNPAKLSFGGIDQSSLTFLWGSPDTFNNLIFRRDGVEVATFTGSLITGSPSAGSRLVTYGGGLFDEVWFESVGSNAFEFASITTTPVPLPAGAVLFLTGLGGFAMFRRRKS